MQHALEGRLQILLEAWPAPRVLCRIKSDLFAVMLFVFEAMSFLPKPIAYVDAVYRANFGFMYKPATKAVFLVFVGFLQFGLDSSHSNALGLSCGILTISSGILMAVVYCKDTSIFDAPGEKYTPPAIPPIGSDQASV